MESTRQDQQRALANVLRANGLPAGYSLRTEFREAWRRWTADAPAQGVRSWAFAIDGGHLPYVLDPARLATNRAQIIVRLAGWRRGHARRRHRTPVRGGRRPHAGRPDADRGAGPARHHRRPDDTAAPGRSAVHRRPASCRVGIARHRVVNGVPQTLPIDPAAVEDAWVVLRLVPA